MPGAPGPAPARVDGVEDRITALGIWSGPIDVTPLTGGLSNQGYVVRDGGTRYVVRFGRDYPFHHVFRDREAMTARAAHAAGCGPEVVHAAPGVMVSRFIDGITYDATRVRAALPRIAALLRQFHTALPRHVTGPGFMFWVFHVIRDYAHTLADSRFAGKLPGMVALAAALEAVQQPLPIVFGHNDLLPANFIDDGTRLWLIDFEYAGFSTALFDLASAAAHAGADDAEAAELLSTYFDTEPDPVLWQSFLAMQCAALLREAMWSMVSERHLDTPGVDFAQYTDENLTRLDQALAHYQSRYGKIVE